MVTQNFQDPDNLEPEAAAFYRGVLVSLSQAQIRFLLGGGFALKSHTGISRCTKDLDLFVLPGDAETALAQLSQSGYECELTYPHWLGKVRQADNVVDIIFSSGNGLCPVDEEWFAYATTDELLGLKVPCAPPEEMIWQKSFIMERHRYDGADVVHLLHCCGANLDWQRLVRRFQDHWKMLFVHLVMADFVFPGRLSSEAMALMDELAARLMAETRQRACRPQGRSRETSGTERPICRGTFLSLFEYLPAVQSWGYQDARLPPTGVMSSEEIDRWTATVER